MSLLTVKFEVDDSVNEAALRDMVRRFNEGETGEAGTLKFETQQFDFDNIESMELGPDDEEVDDDGRELDEDEDDDLSASPAASA